MKTSLLVLGFTATMITASAARHYVVAAAPFLPPESRDPAARNTARLFYESEPGTRVTVLDAARLTTVASFTVPAGTVKLRQSLAMPVYTNAVQFLRSATNPVPRVNQPLLFDHIGRQVKSAGEDVTVLLLCPALYRDPREPQFDMATNWPSDAHLLAGRQRSIFSTVERAHVLDAVTVDWFVTDDGAAANTIHSQAIARFWNLFVGSQGGTLSGYSPDLANAFSLAWEGRQSPYQTVAVDPRDTEVAMRSQAWEPPVKAETTPRLQPLTVINVVTTTNIVTQTNEVQVFRNAILPAPAFGKSLIGAIWITAAGESRLIDMDLHVRIPMDGTELSFKNKTSANARYFRDVRRAVPALEGDVRADWEAVELAGELPSEVWLDLFSGRGPVQGEIRVLHRGREHRIAFLFPAVKGDGGTDSSRRDRSEHWLRIDLTSIARTP